MSSFLAGVAAALLLTICAVFVYDVTQVETIESASPAGVHVSER